MSDFKQLYLQGGYCDCTEVIETIIQESYCCITSNESAGLSTFLSTLQYFFDRRQDMRQIFNSLNISKSSNYKKY